MGVLSQAEIVCVCNERRGQIARRAVIIDPSPEEIQWLFWKMKGLPSMFQNTPMADATPIAQALVNGWKLFLVDHVGLMAVGNTYMNGYIDVHITMWDRILRGREDLAREVAAWFREYREAEGVYTVIPASSKATIEFAKRVGFRVTNWYSGATRNSRGDKDDAVLLTMW